MMRTYGKKKSSSRSVGGRSIKSSLRHKSRSPKHKSRSPTRRSSRSPNNGGSNLEKNEKGEICKWDAHNQDGRELKIYVETGCCDGMTAKPIRLKYPQFQKYAYQTFNGALGNARKSFNTQVRNRAAGLCEFFFVSIHYIFHYLILCYCLIIMQ